jgi:hypothetical protein
LNINRSSLISDRAPLAFTAHALIVAIEDMPPNRSHATVATEHPNQLVKFQGPVPTTPLAFEPERFHRELVEALVRNGYAFDPAIGEHRSPPSFVNVGPRTLTRKRTDDV